MLIRFFFQLFIAEWFPYLPMSYDMLEFPKISFHHWLMRQMSEKEKKKITIVFKTSRGVLHFYGKKEELLNSIAKETIPKLQITGSKRPDDRQAWGLETPLSLEHHCRSGTALAPPPGWEKVKTLCFTFLSSMVGGKSTLV